MKRTDNNEYVLSRNLDTVDFWTFYKSLSYSLPRRDDIRNVHADDIWMQRIGPDLIESDDFLAAKLSIPLSTIFQEK